MKMAGENKELTKKEECEEKKKTIVEGSVK